MEKRKKFFNYNFLVLIFIARNIKTNDFHFILDVSQETAKVVWVKLKEVAQTLNNI